MIPSSASFPEILKSTDAVIGVQHILDFPFSRLNRKLFRLGVFHYDIIKYDFIHLTQTTWFCSAK